MLRRLRFTEVDIRLPIVGDVVRAMPKHASTHPQFPSSPAKCSFKLGPVYLFIFLHSTCHLPQFVLAYVLLFPPAACTTHALEPYGRGFCVTRLPE